MTVHNITHRILARQRKRLRAEAGSLLENLQTTPEAEFDARAADVLAQWDRVAKAAAQDEEHMALRPIYTPEEAAEYLKVSPRVVRDLLRARTLKGIKVGKEWRVAEADLEAYIEGLRAAPFEADGDTDTDTESGEPHG